MSKRAAIYIRVSTEGQTVDNQCLELEQAAKGFVTLIRRSTCRTGGGRLCRQDDMVPRRNCRDAEQSVGPS